MKVRLLVVSWAALAALAGCEARIDPEVARRYPCDPAKADPRECPGGFVCGLEGFCRDPNAPGNWLCAATTDCPNIEGQLWHCGYPNGFDDPMRCYDRVDAGAVACRYDAGVSDCAPDWKCGVEGRCHDQTPRPYPCFSDDDCEGGWRCGLDAVCRDTTREALQPVRPARDVIVERLNPQLPRDPIDFAVRHSSFFLGGEEYLAAHDGGLTYAEFPVFGRRADDGGVIFAERHDLAVLPVPSAVAFEYTFGQSTRSPIAATGGLLKDFSEALFEVAGRALEVARVPAGSQLRQMTSSTSALRVNFAFSGSSFSIFHPEEGWGSNILPMPDAGVPYAIRDIVEVLPHEGCDDCGYAAAFSTDIGLFFAPRTTDWLDLSGAKTATPLPRPVEHPLLPNAACTPGPGANLGRIRTQTTSEFDAARFAIAAERFEDDGGVSVVVAEYSTGDALPTESCSSMAIGRATSCPACPNGGVLEELALDTQYLDVADASVEFFEPIVRCAISEGDGGVVRGLWSNVRGPDLETDGGCHYKLIQNARTAGIELRGSNTVPEDFDSVDRAGNPYACRTSYDPDRCYALLMSTRPEAVIGDPESGWFMGFNYLPGNDGGTFAEGWRWEPGIGMALMERDSFCVQNEAIIGSVRGRPDWILTYDFTRGGVEVRPTSTLQLTVGFPTCATRMGPPLATLQNAATVDFTSPDRVRTFAAAANTPDGGTALVIAAGDRVWAVDVNESFAADGGGPSVAVRAVPLPFTNITSMTVLEPIDPATYASGYVITNQRLFRIAAETPELFDAREIAVPGSLVSVFADGNRGRVGTRTGDVYSLPIPVRIGEGPLAPDDPVAEDFGAACGDTFAIGRRGLYRLEPRPDSPVGRWVRVDTSGAFPPDPALADLHDSRFHSTGSGLYVVTGRGLVYRVGYDDCDEPAPAPSDGGL